MDGMVVSISTIDKGIVGNASAIAGIFALIAGADATSNDADNNENFNNNPFLIYNFLPFFIFILDKQSRKVQYQ